MKLAPELQPVGIINESWSLNRPGPATQEEKTSFGMAIGPIAAATHFLLPMASGCVGSCIENNKVFKTLLLLLSDIAGMLKPQVLSVPWQAVRFHSTLCLCLMSMSSLTLSPSCTQLCIPTPRTGTRRAFSICSACPPAGFQACTHKDTLTQLQWDLRPKWFECQMHGISCV